MLLKCLGVGFWKNGALACIPILANTAVQTQGCPWLPEEAPPTVGQQILERGACREQNGGL